MTSFPIFLLTYQMTCDIILIVIIMIPMQRKEIVMDIYSIANQMKFERKTIFDIPMRVTYYARVSTTKEEQENSIENQIEHFEEMIMQNKNWEYVQGYVDKIRGESAANRVNFLQMIEDGKSGMFDLIITKEVSRFARNTIDSLTYTRDLLRAGVGVFFQNDNICTIDTDSELRLTIMSSMAADEVRKLSERVKFGHAQAIKNGKVLGNSRIFGYDCVNCKLVINEKEAEMVKLIFNLYSTGDHSVRSIERILYEKGYRGRNGGNRIHHKTISGIIQNPKYKGYYCGNKVKIIDYRTKEQKFLPEEEWVMYKDENVPAIVDEEIWNKCNQIFKERSQIIKSREHSFKNVSPLSGKIFCAVCNKTYWRTSYSNSVSKGNPIYTWICGNKKKFGTKICKSFSILEKDLNDIIFDYFKKLVPNLREYIEEFVKMLSQISEDDIDIQRQIITLENKISKYKNTQSKLLDAYLEETITKNNFTEKNIELEQKISTIKTEIDKLILAKEDTKDKSKSLFRIKNYLENLYDGNNESKSEIVESIVKILIDKIYIYPIDEHGMRIEIVLKTGEKGDYICEKANRCSGIIFKKMCPERKYVYRKFCIGYLNHQKTQTFTVCIKF